MMIFALKDTQAQVVKNLLVFKDEDMAKQAMQELLYDKYAVNKVQLHYKHLDLYKVGTMSDTTMEFAPSLEFVCSLSSLVRPYQQEFLDLLHNHFFDVAKHNLFAVPVDQNVPDVGCVNEVCDEDQD